MGAPYWVAGVGLTATTLFLDDELGRHARLVVPRLVAQESVRAGFEIQRELATGAGLRRQRRGRHSYDLPRVWKTKEAALWRRPLVQVG